MRDFLWNFSTSIQWFKLKRERVRIDSKIYSRIKSARYYILNWSLIGCSLVVWTYFECQMLFHLFSKVCQPSNSWFQLFGFWSKFLEFPEYRIAIAIPKIIVKLQKRISEHRNATPSCAKVTWTFYFRWKDFTSGSNLNSD